MTADEQPSTRPGSGPDLSRRLERVEANHERLAVEVGLLAGTVARVELNQKHAEELNKLRFDSLETGVNGVRESLDRFMARINALISGEVRLPQSDALLKDWTDWRTGVEVRLDDQAVLNGQVKLLGRLAVLLVTSNLLALGAAIYAALNA